MPESTRGGDPARRAHAVGLAIVAITAAGMAHPNLVSKEGYSSYEMFVFVLNGAVFCLLLAHLGVSIFVWARRPFVSSPLPVLSWVAPLLLFCFAAIHLGYDTLFYGKFPKLLIGLIRGFNP